MTNANERRLMKAITRAQRAWDELHAAERALAIAIGKATESDRHSVEAALGYSSGELIPRLPSESHRLFADLGA